MNTKSAQSSFDIKRVMIWILWLSIAAIFVFVLFLQRRVEIVNIRANFPGDCDGDGFVDLFDYGYLSRSFSLTQGQPGFDGRCDFHQDQFNIIDLFDYQILANNFGRTGPSITPTPATGIILNPVEDSYVASGNSNSNYGTSDRLIASNFDTNIRSAYLKFNVGTGTHIQSVHLKLTAALDRAIEKKVFTSGTNWNELGIKYDNRPQTIAEVGFFDHNENSLAVGEVIDIPLDASKLTPDTNGFISIVIDNATSNNTFSFYSRESNDKPQLIINGGQSVTATPTRPAGITNTPTPRPTLITTPTPGGPTPTPYTGAGIGPISLSYRQGGIWLTPSEISQIPTNNAGWDQLVTWANKTPNMSDLQCTSGGACGESHSGRILYAKAIVGMRTNNQTMINQAKAGLDQVDEAVNQYLGRNTDIKWGERNMPYLAVTANILDYRPPALVTAIRKVIREYIWPEGKTIETAGLTGLANKPAHGRWGLLTLAYLQEDWVTVNKVVQAEAKFMGEKDWGGTTNTHKLVLSGLGNDDNWQTLQPGGKSDPIGIMPAGTMWNGHGVGGLYLADQYRAGNGPVWPPSYTNYSYEGFGPNLSVAFSADHLGYRNVFQLGNYAVLRMLLWQYSSHDGKSSWPASGNDVWTVAAVMTWAKPAFGNSLPPSLKPEPDATVPWPIPIDPGGDPGRSMGFMYATHYARLAM